MQPPLRFKEFNDDWGSKTVADLSSTISAGATPSTFKKEYWGGDIRWMNSGELNLKQVYEVENRITEKGYKNSSTKMVPVKSILIGLAGQGKTRGTVAINHVDLCTNQSIAAIHPNPNVFDSFYLFYNLEKRYDELRAISAGDGGRGGLNLQIIKSIQVKTPSISEQTKIASFLLAVDEKITQLTKKHELLSRYKTGVMQKIFNQELRFKADDGADYPDWEAALIGDLVDEKTSKYNPDKSTTNFPCIELEHISQRSGQLLDFANSSDLKSIKNRFKKGEVLFGKLRPYLRKYLRPDFDGVCSTEIWVLKSTILLNDYLFYLVQTNSFINLANQSTGSKMPRADWDVVSNANISYPTHKEQSKIANFLSAIDKKIQNTQAQLESAKQYKQGLLQQMFI